MRNLMLAGAMSRLIGKNIDGGEYSFEYNEVILQPQLVDGKWADPRYRRSYLSDVGTVDGPSGLPAMDFTGTSSSFTMNTPLLNNSGDMTIEAWICMKSDNRDNQYFLDLGANGITLRIYGREIGLWINGGKVIVPEDGWYPSVGTWFHIAVVKEESLYTIYINGQAKGSVTNATYKTFTTCTLGNYGGGGNYYSNCMMANVRYSRVAQYQGDFTPSAKPHPFPAPALRYDPYYNDVVSLVKIENGLPVNIIDGTVGSLVGGASVVYDEEFGGNVFSFDANGYAAIPMNASHKFSDDFAIEFWFKLDSNTPKDSSVRTLVGRREGTKQSGWCVVSRSGNSAFSHNSETSSISTDAIAGAMTLPTGTWHHIAVARNGYYLLTYFDGQVVSSQACNNRLAGGDIPLYIGGSSVANSGIRGRIANVRVTKKSRYLSRFVYPSKNEYPTTHLGLPDCDPHYNANYFTFPFNKSLSPMVSQVRTLIKAGTPSIDSETKLFGEPTGMFKSGEDSIAVEFNLETLSVGDFTVDGWVRTTYSGNAVLPFIEQRTSTSGWALRIRADGLYFEWNRLSLHAPVAVNDGAWHHIAVDRKDGLITIYVDGVPIASSVSIEAIRNAGIVQIGSAASGVAKGHLMHVSRIRVTGSVARYGGVRFTPDELGTSLKGRSI